MIAPITVQDHHSVVKVSGKQKWNGTSQELGTEHAPEITKQKLEELQSEFTHIIIVFKCVYAIERQNDRKGKTEITHLLVHSSEAHNSQD